MLIPYHHLSPKAVTTNDFFRHCQLCPGGRSKMNPVEKHVSWSVVRTELHKTSVRVGVQHVEILHKSYPAYKVISEKDLCSSGRQIIKQLWSIWVRQNIFFLEQWTKCLRRTIHNWEINKVDCTVCHFHKPMCTRHREEENCGNNHLFSVCWLSKIAYLFGYSSPPSSVVDYNTRLVI